MNSQKLTGPQKRAVSERADERIADAIARFKATGSPVQVSFREMCSAWPWAKRSDVMTHYMHRYPAKMLPYIPILFLSSSLASEGDIVLDGFAGTGTVGLECISHPATPRDCLLADISPLARLISSAKVTPQRPESLRSHVGALHSTLERMTKVPDIPEFPGISFWFRDRAQTELARLYTLIDTASMGLLEKDFFWACLSSIIRDTSRADPRIAPPVRLSAKKIPSEAGRTPEQVIARKGRMNPQTLFFRAAYRNLARLSDLWEAMHASGHWRTALVIGGDARRLTISTYLGKGELDARTEAPMPDNSIGMVICSPPYINAQKYARSTKLELWWMGLINRTAEGLRSLDSDMIGTERIGSGEGPELALTGVAEADHLVDAIAEKSVRAARMVSKYYHDMSAALSEIARVLRPGKYCILVVGNNAIRTHVAPNHIILAEIAKRKGLDIEAMLVDEIRSRGMITKRHPTAGMIRDEWIMLLRKPVRRMR